LLGRDREHRRRPSGHGVDAAREGEQGRGKLLAGVKGAAVAEPVLLRFGAPIRSQHRCHSGDRSRGYVPSQEKIVYRLGCSLSAFRRRAPDWPPGSSLLIFTLQGELDVTAGVALKL